MAMRMNRRALLAFGGAALVAGCGGVKPYADMDAPNMEMRLTAIDGGFMTSRNVFLDVWTGPKGPDMEYLGTRKFSSGSSLIGLPTGRPLHLALAFEEAGWLAGGTATQTIEIPMKAISPGQMHRLTVAFDDIGFDWDLKRIR